VVCASAHFPDTHETRAAVIARGAQTVWPSPPVHRPTVCSPVLRLRHSLTSLALATQLRLNCDSTATGHPTCDSTPTCDWTCDSLLSALSKVVISASATSQGTDHRLHPKAIVTAPQVSGIDYPRLQLLGPPSPSQQVQALTNTYTFRHTPDYLPPPSQRPLTTTSKHKGIDYSLHPRHISPTLQHPGTLSQTMHWLLSEPIRHIVPAYHLELQHLRHTTTHFAPI